jgi:hypothetical protein
MAPLRRGSANVNEALLMKRSRYYIRVMRPTFQRAILTVEAESDQAAVRSVLEEAERLTESDWARLEAVREPPVIEIALSEDETERDTEAGVLEFVSDVQDAYALLQADLEAGEGAFIAPTWLKRQPELMIADITQDWTEALPQNFDGLLLWGHIYNRPFLRCLHGYGLCRWRMGQLPQAQQVFERILSLNPNDNQGIRFCWDDVRSGRSWDEMQAREGRACFTRVPAYFSRLDVRLTPRAESVFKHAAAVKKKSCTLARICCGSSGEVRR